jgi:phosphoglycerate dehydrogenase-like enzyme
MPDVPQLVHLGALPPNVEVVRYPREGDRPDVAAADLVVPTDWMRVPVMDALQSPGRLRVIQTLSAGVDWLIGRVPEDVTVCNARGVFDIPLAEWVIGAILATQRGLVGARDAQREGDWRRFEPRELAGRRVVIVGFGSIAAAVAERLGPFGVEVIGVARTAREGVHGLGELDRLLPGADILVDLLPLSTETAGLLDARRLALLPDGALLVNGGRGGTVVTDALIAELAAGRLRAALDVTDPEPLPAGHPLWALPNVLVTPHIAGDSPEAIVRSFALAGDQVRRFAAGEPLHNEVPRHLLV